MTMNIAAPSRELHSENFDLCRVCLLEPESNRGMTFFPIFGVDDHSAIIRQKICELLQVKVEKNDVKPKIICKHCHDSIINWSEMKKKAAEAQIVINYIAKKRFGLTELSQSTSNDPGPSLEPKNSVPATSSMLPIQSKSSTHSETRRNLQSNRCAGSSHQGHSSQSVIANQSTSAYGHESDDDASCHEVKVANEVIYVSSESDDDEGNFKSNPSNNDIIRYCSICKDHKKFDHDCSLYNKEFSTCLVPNCNILSRSVRDFDPHYRQHIGFTAREWICRRCYRENKKSERDANGRHICCHTVNVFKCYTCGLVLNSMAEFANHKLKKHNGRLINSAGNFLCLYCEKSSPDMMKIDEHIKQNHYKKNGNVKENAVEYGIKHREPKVPETTVIMNDRNVAKKNINFGQENVNKFEYSYKHVFFTCLKPSCNLIFQYFPNFKFHHREHFKTGNKVMCWQCCSPFNTVADLRFHQVKGNCRTPGMFNCFQCPEAFDDIEHLSIHKYIVHNGQLVIQKKGQKTVICPSCKLHVGVNGFKNHLIQCYSNKSYSSTKSKPVPQFIKKTKQFKSNKCGICGKICLTRAALSSHIKVHNPNRATKLMKKRSNVGTYKEDNSGHSSLSQDNCETDFTNLNSDNMCGVVEVSSTTNTSYNNDVQRFVKYDEFPFDNGVYSCIQCPRKFNTKMGLAKHWPFCKPKKIVYTNRANKILSKNYYCTDCKEYFTRAGFGTHYKNIHGKKLALKRCKRYSCTKCPSKFLYKVALSMHYQHMHGELKTSVQHAPNDTSKPVDPVKLPVVSETTSLATDYTDESMEQNEENCDQTIKEEINNTMSQSADDQWEEGGGLENYNSIPEDTLVNTKINEEMINVDDSYEDISILPSEILSIELNDNEMVVEQLDHESTMEVENTNALKENNVTKELEKNNELVGNDETNSTKKNCTIEVITANNGEDNLIIVKKEFIQNNVDERMEVSGVQNTNQIVNKPDKVDQEHNLLVSKEEILGTKGLNSNLVSDVK